MLMQGIEQITGVILSLFFNNSEWVKWSKTSERKGKYPLFYALKMELTAPKVRDRLRSPPTLRRESGSCAQAKYKSFQIPNGVKWSLEALRKSPSHSSQSCGRDSGNPGLNCSSQGFQDSWCEAGIWTWRQSFRLTYHSRELGCTEVTGLNVICMAGVAWSHLLLNHPYLWRLQQHYCYQYKILI